jgi:hypothetical protein
MSVGEAEPRPGARGSLNLLDAAAVIALLGLLVAYSATQVDFAAYPEEDAAMLLRYSRHLADGHGIVWNPGETPVDGATDFLFMVLVAALHRAGVGLEDAARAVGLASHASTALVVFLAARRLFGARWPALLSAVFLASGVGIRYVAACYGTPLFGLTTTLAWWAAHAVVRSSAADVPRRSRLFGVAALAMGLARPEGVFLAVFMLGAALLARGRDARRAVVTGFALPFLTAGLAYFAWRWSYFGYPLPNPFYKKGGGALYWTGLAKSFTNLWRLGTPFLPILAAGLLFRRTRRQAAVALLPVAAFGLLWILISDETNYFMRFRYPALPIVLISWVGVWQGLAGETTILGRFPRLTRALTLLASLGAAAGLVAFQHARYRHIEPQRIGLYDVAMLLKPHAHRGYSLAVTEAGLLPLYSGWRAVDAWGLNDRVIAHQGGVTEEYLDRYRPEVILIHGYDSPGLVEPEDQAARRGLGPRWHRMVATLRRYAERRGYRLAAAFVKNPNSTHYYYVRSDFPESESLTAGIRSLEYYLDGSPRRDSLSHD